TGGGPTPYGMYTVKSKDNNQDGTVGVTQDAEIDEQARGTSFSAASVASAAAIMEDYFRQGFYPTGDRIQGNRIPSVSGSLIKAMLAASANFSEQLIGPDDNSVANGANDNQVATTRGSLVPVTAGVNDVLVNNQQGFGRVIVSQVLPI